jgi:hypothetical protein
VSLLLGVSCKSIESSQKIKNQKLGNQKFYTSGNTLVYNSNMASRLKDKHITFDDAQIFKSQLNSRNIKIVRLTSEGGQTRASKIIGNLIIENNLDTEADGECSSACSLIFVAGKNRKLMGNAKLGFHTSLARINDYKSTRQRVEKLDEQLSYENIITHYTRLESAQEIIFLQKQGIKTSFALKVLQVHPLDMWYPTRSELTKSGVIN